MALKEMYPGMINSPETTITNNINESDTIIYVLDPARVPEPPNLMTLGTGTNAETVKVLEINDNAITVERGFQGVAKSWPAGTVIARNFTEYDYNALKENIEDLEATKETPQGAQAKANAAENAAKQYADQRVNALAGEGNTKTVKQIDDELASHLADDVTLGEIPHIGLGGSISHATNTGEATTPHLRQVNASIRGTASGNMSQVNASQDSTASGERSQVNASRDSTVSGNQSQVNASRTTTVSGQHSFTVGSLNSEVIGNVSGIICAGRNGFADVGGCKVTADNALVLVGRGVLNDEYGSIAGGLPPSYTQTPSPPSTAERKWHIYSTTGDIQIAGQLTPGHSFTDFAELFPNLTGKKQEYGLLQTIDGFGVRPAQAGERVIGVTTATAAIVLGDTPFSWQGRWLKDEWGAYIYETIIDEETGEEITYPKENPEWNPELEQQSRLQRPDEWTVVGLLGQVYVRLKEDVQPMDYVKAWQNGIGQKSLEPTNLQVMKITQEYDAEKGYKIGFCLLR